MGYQTSKLKVPCVPLSMILLAFYISHSLITKGHDQKKKHAPILFKILLSKCTKLDKSSM